MLKSRVSAVLSLVQQVQEDQRTDLIKSDLTDDMNGDVQRGENCLELLREQFLGNWPIAHQVKGCYDIKLTKDGVRCKVCKVFVELNPNPISTPSRTD